MNAFLIWTDYEACEVFASQEDAENYCYNIYGPDKRLWPDIDERKLTPIKRRDAKAYIAIAWWPSWDYNAPPKTPYVAVEYGKRPYVHADDGADKNSPRYEGFGQTEATAVKAAKKLAMAEIPVYTYAQSSNTSSGVLPIYRRADFKGRVGSW